MGVAAVVTAATATAADPRSATGPMDLGLGQEAQQPPDQMTFNDADKLFLYFSIAPEQSTVFEEVLQKMKDALLASTKPERQQQSQHMQVLKLNDLQAGNVLYIFVLDQVVKGVSYDPFKILGESLPADQVRGLYDKVLPGLKGISRAAFTEVLPRRSMN
jgi:hypothetical protein